MADINIQRKKSAPSPWWLVLLAVAALAVGAYFFLQPDPTDEPAPAHPIGQEGAPAGPDSTPTLVRPTPPLAETGASLPDSAVSPEAVGPPEEPVDYSPATLAAQAATDPATAAYAVKGLQKLTDILVSLADRDDLRDPSIVEQRDNLTSATSRLGEANTSLRPGFVATAGLIRAMQQKAYPELEDKANDLVRLASQLSGRSATAADQQQNQQFLTQATAIVRVLSEPAH